MSRFLYIETAVFGFGILWLAMFASMQIYLLVHSTSTKQHESIDMCNIHTMHVSIHYVLYLYLIRITYNIPRLGVSEACLSSQTSLSAKSSASSLQQLQIWACTLANQSHVMWQASVSSSCAKINKIKQSRKARAISIWNLWHRMKLCDTNDNTWPASGAFFDCGFLWIAAKENRCN